MKFLVAMVAVAVLAGEVQAQLFRQRGCSGGACSAQAVPVRQVQVVHQTTRQITTTSTTLYSIALRKSQIQASRGGRCFHAGGGFGGARAEGVGSGATAAQALANCCFTGVRRVAASAVVRGRNGRWYATKLFW